ncbi:MAG TPA: hypothetical protein VG759_20815 [Candidatus Angelobacter sp.]|jgi:hypothetical protein|nr:hypothetical protein [Candidatus Angelobacter sp.]
MTIPLRYGPTGSNPVVRCGRGRFRIETAYDVPVRIPSVVLKSVGFIGEFTDEDSAGLGGDLCATGFFVSIPFKSPELWSNRICYFVTASHVAKELSDKLIYFLVNKRGGGVIGLEPVGDTWGVHPTDRTTDVAIIHVENQANSDITTINVNDLITTEHLQKEVVGVGDEVFVTGLFTEAPGTSRNMPIVRHGNIAMIPDGQIQTDLGYADVYLVEARSIGGLSGSPVFVRPSIEVNVDEGRLHASGPIKLLGLMQGHWDIKESEMNEPSIVHNRKRGVNLGIGVVVPAIKIIETINGPRMVEMRGEYEAIVLHHEKKKSTPGNDMATPRNKKKENFTRQDFEEALKKASRKTESKS